YVGVHIHRLYSSHRLQAGRWLYFRDHRPDFACLYTAPRCPWRDDKQSLLLSLAERTYCFALLTLHLLYTQKHECSDSLPAASYDVLPPPAKNFVSLLPLQILVNADPYTFTILFFILFSIISLYLSLLSY